MFYTCHLLQMSEKEVASLSPTTEINSHHMKWEWVGEGKPQPFEKEVNLLGSRGPTSISLKIAVKQGHSLIILYTTTSIPFETYANLL